MYEYLQDIDFLEKLDKSKTRVQYAKIILLDFQENPIKEITGDITAGSISGNGSSIIRRTISLTMLASADNSNIEDVNNDIAINKKIKVEIGLKNPFRDQYSDEIIWFPKGLYVISSASISRSTSGWNISITAKDKGCLLDGTAGGTLPASTIFHDREIVEDDGTTTIELIKIYDIIFEAVTHWGGEAAENVFISDVPDQVKVLMKYVGDQPIYFDQNYASFSFIYDENKIPYKYGDDVGYKMTDFTYPGELVLSAGETVASLLDKIAKTLGNFEYFYTEDGKFIFQEIKNYLNTGSPFWDLDTNDYVASYTNKGYVYSLKDLDTTTTINRSPKYDQIKNDFYAWGLRKSSSGAEIGIRYHLAIDTKPTIVRADKYMWKIYANSEKKVVLRFDYTDSKEPPQLEGAELFRYPSLVSNNWREELYRRAVEAQYTNSVYDQYYDSELIAEWPKLYNPNPSVDGKPNTWLSSSGWNPDVLDNPGKLNYWLDFIDADSTDAGKYSIKQIGRRSKVVNDNSLKSVYNKEVTDIVFLDGYDEDTIAEFILTGQQYFILQENYQNLFQMSATGASCFDKIREMLYQNLSYNTTIQVTCMPKYYIDVNNIIYIFDRESNIDGNFQITQYTLPLTYNGTMSITATEVLTRV